MNSPAHSYGWLEELSEQECQELLASKHVGRVAYDDGGPVVLPVRYALHEGAILFRTSPHGSLGRSLRASVAAFEVDEIHDETTSGWSVLVRGRASFMAGHELPEMGQRPGPGMEGTQSLYVHITPQLISGRRVHRDDTVGLDGCRTG